MTTSKNNEFSISIMLVLGLLAAVAVIYLFVFSMAEDGFGKNMERVQQTTDMSVAERIKPVVTLQDLIADKDPAVESSTPMAAVRSGQELYSEACGACHGAGVAGAPILGDADAWQPRLDAGFDAMVSVAITGKGAMPPRGGSSFSDEEMRETVEYMMIQAGLM